MTLTELDLIRRGVRYIVKTVVKDVELRNKLLAELDEFFKEEMVK